MSDVIRFNLERHGFKVVVARDGQEAVNRLQCERFDMLVTDYQMPRMNGEELVRTLREARPDDGMPVILLSARGMELDAAQLQAELRIDMVMFKPFSPRELSEAVASCIRQHAVA